ncbi:MAG: MFS transporter [Gammaproteobacteria bacterium]|nr:MFS transporter [Gammaproteobacteria bacterium]
MIPRIRDAAAEYVKRRFFYGWTVVGVAGLGIFASGPGQSHTFSVFVEPISRDLGVSSATIATAYGLATLIAALLLPQAGRAVDRFGPRRALLVIVVLLGLACVFFGAAANFVWLALGFGLLRFLGQGSLMLGCANLVSHWFSRRRGFAMSLMALGFGLSMAVHPPLAQFLVVELGWRQAWGVLGVITWLIMLPPLLLLAYDKAEDLGLRPDGASEQLTQSAAGGSDTTGLTLAEALRTRSFYVLAVGWFAIAMLVTTLHFYQVKLLTSQGVAVAIAASAFTISALTMAVTMPLVGRLFDSVKTRYVFVIGLAVTATSLLTITFADSLVSTVIYALIFGLNNAFSMTMFGYMWPRYFGRRHLGAIQGTGQMVGVVGASLGPLPVGIAFDLIGDPTWTIRLLAIIPVAAAILAFFMLHTHAAIRGDYEHLE